VKKLLVLAAILLAGAGCSTGIQPDAIEGLIKKVGERHDAMLDGTLDPKTVSAADKATYKRSVEILNKIVAEAKKK
jgi:hypothetical protein